MTPETPETEAISPPMPMYAEPKRRDKKRRFRKVPPMPVSVRALWESAGEEERALAHRRCAMILETWLGRTSRPAAAEALEITPVRLWQLSQRALAGMLAGLVTQPRTRGRVTMGDPADDPKVLRKRIADLESELLVATDLITLLRELPTHREADTAAVKKVRSASRTKAKKKKRAARRKVTKTNSPRREVGEKKAATDAPTPAGDADGSGPLAG